MLDQIFKYMASEGISEWKVHGRICTNSGFTNVDIPHSLSDGRYFLSRVLMPLMQVCASDDVQFAVPNERVLSFPIVGRATGRTRFQTFLQGWLLSDPSSDMAKICIAVANTGGDIDPKKRNNVAFPIFEKRELIDLCELPALDWKRRLEFAAASERQTYSRICEQLALLEHRKIERFLRLAPIQRADLVISYFGDLSRFLQTSLPHDLNCLQIGVTNSFGPSRVMVCYGSSGRIRGVSSFRGQEIRWDDSAFCWDGLNA